MKNFFGKLFGNTQKKLQNSQKSHDCKHHNFERFPSIKSNEECLDCGIKMCYMCGNQHIERKCTINCNEINENC